MYVPAIIYLFILPFAAIYTLVWTFLQMLEVFTHVSPNVNRVLAFIIAFLTIPMGWFVKTVWVLFSFMGIFSVVVFAAIFLIGVFFRGFVVATKEYVKTFKTYENVWNELQSKLDELQKRVDNLSSEDIEREVNRLSEKYGALYPKLKDLAFQVLDAKGVENKRKVVKEFKL
jgi:tetrahydromethanopterin S-methyltransferase subunit G